MQEARIHEIQGDRRARKREAFRKLAEKRTNAILEKVRILGNLANRSAYEYSEDEVRRIFSALDEEVRATKAKFRAGVKRQFRLD